MFAAPDDFKNVDVAPISPSGKLLDKGFRESFADAWNYQRFSGNSSSKQDNLHEEYEAYIDEIRQKTGEELENPYRSGWGEYLVEDIVKGGLYDLVHIPGTSRENAPYSQQSKAARDERNLKNFYTKLDKIREKHPEIPYKSFNDIQQNIQNKAQEWREKLASGRQDNDIAAFMGTMSAAMTDPVNATATLLTAPITGGAGGTLMQAIGRTAIVEGGINTLTEAMIQPDVYQYNKELGNNYTAKDAVLSVAMAGAGGALFSSAAVAGGSILRKSIGKYKELKAKGYKFKPLEDEAADIVSDRLQLQDFLDESNPFGSSEVSEIFHEENLLREMDRLRQAQEMADLARAYDQVAADPLGNPLDPLIQIAPEDMENVWIERGKWKKIDGSDAKSGYGLIKFIFKHGPDSDTKIPVMKDDVVRFPEIIRKYQPLSADKYGENRIWSVKRQDGVQVIYADKRLNDGNKHLVTIHTVDPDWQKTSLFADIYSPEITPKEISSKKKPPIPDAGFYDPRQDTASGTFSRPRREEAISDNITPELKIVKEGDEIRYPKTEELSQLLAEKDALLPLDEVNGELRHVSARQVVEEIKKEDSWIDEINSCIVEFGKK